MRIYQYQEGVYQIINVIQESDGTFDDVLFEGTLEECEQELKILQKKG